MKPKKTEYSQGEILAMLVLAFAAGLFISWILNKPL